MIETLVIAIGSVVVVTLLLFGCYVVFGVKNKTSVAWMIATISLVFAWMILTNILVSAGTPSWFRHANIPLSLTWGPLLFLYFYLIANDERVYKKQYWLHFLPAILLPTIWFVEPFFAMDWITVMITCFYCGASVYVLNRDKDRFDSSVLFRILVAICLVFIVINLLQIVVILQVTSGVQLWQSSAYLTLLLLLTVLSLLLLASSLVQPKLLLLPVAVRQRIGASFCSDDETLKTVSALRIALETDKIYRDSEITIKKLGGLLNAPERYLSQVINQHYETNFSALMNRYRVLEAAELLKDTERNKNMTAIMYDVGFGSTSTFHREFAKVYHMTPGQFRKEYNQ